MNYQIRKMAPNHHFMLNGLPLEPLSRTYQYRKIMKPMLERKRRARINKCLDELKDLMTGTLQADGENVSKLEKADILELTVRHLHRLRENNALFVRNYETMNMDKFWAGFQHCAAEVSQFLNKYDQSMGGDLVKHIANFIPNVTAARAFVAAAAAASTSTSSASGQVPTTAKYHHQHQHSPQSTAPGALAMNLSAAPTKAPTAYQRLAANEGANSNPQHYNGTPSILHANALKCENATSQSRNAAISPNTSVHKLRMHPYANAITKITTTTPNSNKGNPVQKIDVDDCGEFDCDDSAGVWRPW